MALPTLGAGPSSGLSYLLRDEFTSALAAGNVDNTLAEPGPGTRYAAEANGGTVSIAAGSVVLVGGNTSYNDANFSYDETFARVAGILLFFQSFVSTSSMTAFWGGDGDRSAQYTDSYFAMSGNRVRPAGIDTDGLSAGTHTFAIILRSAGAWYLWLNGADWDLLWVNATAADDPVYVGATNYTVANLNIGSIRVAQLGAPWNTDDYGIATQRLAGARAPGDTFTHEADCLINFTVATLPTAGQVELRLRIQDATNYWQVTVDSAGDLDLDEVVAGVATQRGTSAGVVAAGETCTIVADNETINVLDTSARRINYTSAVNFKTETDGELETEGTGGAVTDIVSWPRTLSGAALAQINNIHREVA